MELITALLKAIAALVSDASYMTKIWKSIRRKEEIHAGDIVTSLRSAFSNKDIAIRVHIRDANESIDAPFTKAVEEKDIPDYTILFAPDTLLKIKIKENMFSQAGEYGWFSDERSFGTSELIFQPSEPYKLNFQSLFILGKIPNLDTSTKFSPFQELPLSSFVVTNCFVVEKKHDKQLCYKGSANLAEKLLLQINQLVTNNSTIHCGIGLNHTQKFGNESKMYNLLS